MRRYLQLILLAFSLIALHSCDLLNDDSEEELIGKWDDIIKLSTKTATLESSEGSVTITTGGTWWWLASISVNDHHYYDFDGVDMESSSYSIQRDCVTFQRVDEHTIFIKVDENSSGTKRTISVSLQAGDYFDGITLTQEPTKN